MINHSSKWIFTLALISSSMSTTNSQNYVSSIARMQSLPSLQANILKQLEILIADFRNDLKVINETRTRLKAVKVQTKHKVDLFVYLNKLLTFRKHATKKYKLVLNHELPTIIDLDRSLFNLIVLQSTYELDINRLIGGYIEDKHTKLDLLTQLMMLSTYYSVHESHVHPIEALHETIVNTDFRKLTLNELQATAKMYNELIFDKLISAHKRYVIKLLNYLISHMTTNNQIFLKMFFAMNNDFLTENMEAIVKHKVSLDELRNECKVGPSVWNPYEGEKFFEITLEQYHHYSKLCQGVPLSSSKIPLKCYFDTNGDFYHLLNPFKLEELCLDPLILVYRDFVRERELEILIQESVPYLSKSQIGHKGKGYDSNIRVSQNTWLDYIPAGLEGLYQRIVSATPLADEAEALQVNNYGIGGVYTPHLDNMYQTSNPDLAFDRLATFMIYVTDVEAGGATVFPRLNLTFLPARGSAILWYNLYANWSPDHRTLHAGCPVLKGDKWVVNKWYSTEGQMFTYPCKRDEIVLSKEMVLEEFSHY